MTVAFQSPDMWRKAVDAGNVLRMGSALYDTGSNLHAFLVETEGYQPAIESALQVGAAGAVVHPFIGVAIDLAEVASAIASNVQLEQVKWLLKGVGMLNAATLGASLVGVGVSVAGFEMVRRRLDRLQDSIDGLKGAIAETDRKVDVVSSMIAAKNWAGFDALLYQAEAAWHATDPSNDWKGMLMPLLFEDKYFRALLGRQQSASLFLNPRFPIEQVTAAYEAALRLASLRVQTLLLLDEMDQAIHYAEDVRRWHKENILNLKRKDLADARRPANADYGFYSASEAKNSYMQEIKPLVDTIHEVQASIDSRVMLLRSLKEQGIKGREYIETVRNRKDSPLLLLAPTASGQVEPVDNNVTSAQVGEGKKNADTMGRNVDKRESKGEPS